MGTLERKGNWCCTPENRAYAQQKASCKYWARCMPGGMLQDELPPSKWSNPSWHESRRNDGSDSVVLNNVRDDSLDIEMLADAEEEESDSITTTLGFIAAATAATAAGLFIARLKCSKKDEDFERV